MIVAFKRMIARSDLTILLQRLLSLPTAPFHESFVFSFLCEELKKAGVDFLLDQYGNISAGALGPECWVACVAHMDHPGFEIVEGGNEKAVANWFGGVDAKYFTGARVVIYNRASGAIRARGFIKGIARNPQGRVEKMNLRVTRSVEPGDFGTWDLVPFRRRGDMIFTKGADDLVGCAVILVLLKTLKERGMGGVVRGVFTRAEEQGFIGTLGMIRSGSVSPTTKIISVETSKALAGVVLGGGPVIRLGDRAGMFHHQMVLFMDYVAKEMKKKNLSFAFQRRVMDGGTCEATPYQLRGYMAGGIAVPLHNYHNQGKTRIGAEGVHLKDVEGAVRLLVELAGRMDEFDTPITNTLERFETSWQKYGARLQMECQGIKGSKDQGIKGYK